MKIVHTFRIHPGDTGSEIFFHELSNEMKKKGHSVSIITSDLKKWRHFLNFYSNRLTYNNNILIKRIPSTIFRFIFSRFTYSRENVIIKFIDLITLLIEQIILKLLVIFFKKQKNALLWGLFQDEIGWKMRYFLKKENCDLIHTTCIPRSCITASLVIAKLRKIPIMISPFYHYRDKSFNMNDNFWMKILNQFDCINISTDAEAKYLISHGINKKKIVKIGVGVYFEKRNLTSDINWRKKLDISTDKFVVLYMNSQIYNPLKGILQVIGAALKLPTIEFIFTGNDETSWKRMISDHFANENLENCHYLGYILEEEKNPLIKSADLIVRPSINEALGIVYIEAMGEGKPIITSDIESMKEISENVGFAVKHGNIDQLVNAINEIQSNKMLYSKFSQNALKKSEDYNWKIVSEKFNLIYKSLINSNDKN